MDRDNAKSLKIKNEFSDDKKYFCLLVSTVPFSKDKFYCSSQGQWLLYIVGLLFSVVSGCVACVEHGYALI